MNKKKKVVVCKMDDEGMMGVQAISLVDAPAIMENFVALSKGNKIKLAEVDAERRMVFGPVLIPDLHILRIDEQGEEYYMTFPKETILETSQRYMKMQQQNNATIDHALTVQGCTVVETWIKESEMDKSVQLGFIDIPVGSWFVGMKIENDTVWSGIKQGSFNGFSIEGFYNMMSQQFCDSVNYHDAMTDLLELEKLLAKD
jgi:hypothetical protein